MESSQGGVPLKRSQLESYKVTFCCAIGAQRSGEEVGGSGGVGGWGDYHNKLKPAAVSESMPS